MIITQRYSISSQRCTFTAQFKCEAASLVLDQDYSYTEAAELLDLGSQLSTRKVKRFVQQPFSEQFWPQIT